MLTTIARRVQHRHALTRTLFTVVAVAVAVIVGLLAMHSMNTHAMAAGHSDTVAVAGSDHANDHAIEMTTGDSAAECATCADGHAMAWVACVLAVLVTVILRARPAAWWRPLAHVLGRPTTLLSPRGAVHGLMPPSLTVLCISRT